MDNRTRFHQLMQFEAVDRLPAIEWAGYWDKTVERWRREGLTDTIEDRQEIRDYLGLDCYRQHWIAPKRPPARAHGAGVVSNMDEYEALKAHGLYPAPQDAFDHAMIEAWAERQAKGDMVVWISLEGYFWFPRTLLGIERHLYAFYETPELIMAMNEDLTQFNLAVLDEFCRICVPDFMTFAEDMSYNNGPMVSRELFEQFETPFYRRIVPRLEEYGIYRFVDTDGEIGQLIPWFVEVGVDGFLPLERQAGCDIAQYRRDHPKTRYIGAYDKMVMNRGEAAMRAEFERLLPVMRQGGFIPSVDHQTPPGVSFEDYHIFLRLLREYCTKAAE